MRVVRIREKYKAGDEFTLWPISDTHLGAADTDEDALRRHVAEIQADPMARWIFLGDVGDLIDHRDKRFHPGMWPQRYQDAMFAEGGIPTEVVEHAVEIFAPIRDKCWVWLSGNHERTIRNRYDREIGSEIAGRLGVEYLGYGGFLKVDFSYVNQSPSSKGETYSPLIFDLHHGWQGGRRSGAKVNSMELDLGMSDADIILRGHSHDKVAHRFDSFQIGAKYALNWPRIVAHCGTYKLGRTDHPKNGELHDTWEVTRGFRNKASTSLGPPLIDIKPRAFVNKRTNPDNARFHFQLRH